MQELASILAEEITPKLDNLRAEKQQFLAWQKEHAELERIGCVLRGYEWTATTRRVQSVDDGIDQKGAEHAGLDQSKKKLLKALKLAEEEHEDVKARREAELRKGGKLKKLEDEVAEFEKELEKFQTQVDLANGNVTDTQEDQLTQSQSTETHQPRQSFSFLSRAMSFVNHVSSHLARILSAQKTM